MLPLALLNLALITASFVGVSPANTIPVRPDEFKGAQVGSHSQCNFSAEKYGWSDAKRKRCYAYAVKSTQWLFGS